MAHHSRICKVVVDVPDRAHAAEVAFWAGASGRPLPQLAGAPEYYGGDLRNPRLWMLVQRLENEDEPARVHLDIHTDDVAAEVARLERLGAVRVRKVHSWWVMRDPAGLLFCVIAHQLGVLNEGNSQRWDSEEEVS